MPFCPVCHYEYEKGVAKCPDCDVELVDSLPEIETIDEELVTVYTAEDENEAMMVKNILEEAGIPVWEKPDEVIGVDPFPVVVLPEDSINVPASREAEARRVIEEALSTGKLISSESEEE